jgi:hypothetical protein
LAHLRPSAYIVGGLGSPHPVEEAVRLQPGKRGFTTAARDRLILSQIVAIAGSNARSSSRRTGTARAGLDADVAERAVALSRLLLRSSNPSAA